MGKICMCHIDIDPDSMEIVLSDIQRIEKVPESVLKVAYQYMKGKRILKHSGLPSVQYLGSDRVQVVGAFTYGEISFIEIEGKWSNIIKQESLLCIKPYREDASYEELLEGESEYMESLKREANSEE